MSKLMQKGIVFAIAVLSAGVVAYTSQTEYIHQTQMKNKPERLEELVKYDLKKDGSNITATIFLKNDLDVVYTREITVNDRSKIVYVLDVPEQKPMYVDYSPGGISRNYLAFHVRSLDDIK